MWPPSRPTTARCGWGRRSRDLFVFVSGQIAAAIEAKRAEDALRQSETRLRVAIQQVPAVLWTTDEELRFTSSLGAGLSALGLAPNQVVGMALEQYVGDRQRGPREAEARPAGRVRPATTTSRTAGPSPCTSSRCATRRAPSGARWASRWTSPRCAGPTRPCASRRPGCARSSTSCRTSSSRRTWTGRFLLANQAVAEAYGTTVDGLMGRTDADFARSEEEVRHFRETTSR